MADKGIQLVAMDELVPLFKEQLSLGGKVSFTPRGNSMKPMLRHGVDSVELSCVPDRIRKYDLPLYRRDNGKYVLHRVVGVGDSYTCIGDNQYFTEKGVQKSQMVAVVTAFTRNGREYSVDGIGYKLYCRLWHFSRFPRRVLRGILYRARRVLKRR